MVRNRKRRVADLGAEVLHEECRDRPVHHRHVDDLDPYQANQKQRVRVRAGDQSGGVPRNVRGIRHRVVDRDIGDRRDQAPREDDHLSSDLVRKPTEHKEERRPERDRPQHDRV